MPAEAPVSSVTGVMHRSSCAAPLRFAIDVLIANVLAANPPPQLDALARRDAEQIGSPPQQIVLELVTPAVGIDDLPHHFDDAGAAGLVERAVELMGEMIEVDR